MNKKRRNVDKDIEWLMRKKRCVQSTEDEQNDMERMSEDNRGLQIFENETSNERSGNFQQINDARLMYESNRLRMDLPYCGSYLRERYLQEREDYAGQEEQGRRFNEASLQGAFREQNYGQSDVRLTENNDADLRNEDQRMLLNLSLASERRLQRPHVSATQDYSFQHGSSFKQRCPQLYNESLSSKKKIYNRNTNMVRPNLNNYDDKDFCIQRNFDRSVDERIGARNSTFDRNQPHHCCLITEQMIFDTIEKYMRENACNNPFQRHTKNGESYNSSSRMGLNETPISLDDSNTFKYNGPKMTNASRKFLNSQKFKYGLLQSTYSVDLTVQNKRSHKELGVVRNEIGDQLNRQNEYPINNASLVTGASVVNFSVSAPQDTKNKQIRQRKRSSRIHRKLQSSINKPSSIVDSDCIMETKGNPRLVDTGKKEACGSKNNNQDSNEPKSNYGRQELYCEIPQTQKFIKCKNVNETMETIANQALENTETDDCIFVSETNNQELYESYVENSKIPSNQKPIICKSTDVIEANAHQAFDDAQKENLWSFSFDLNESTGQTRISDKDATTNKPLSNESDPSSVLMETNVSQKLHDNGKEENDKFIESHVSSNVETNFNQNLDINGKEETDKLNSEVIYEESSRVPNVSSNVDTNLNQNLDINGKEETDKLNSEVIYEESSRVPNVSSNVDTNLNQNLDNNGKEETDKLNSEVIYEESSIVPYVDQNKITVNPTESKSSHIENTYLNIDLSKTNVNKNGNPYAEAPVVTRNLNLTMADVVNCNGPVGDRIVILYADDEPSWLSISYSASLLKKKATIETVLDSVSNEWRSVLKFEGKKLAEIACGNKGTAVKLVSFTAKTILHKHYFFVQRQNAENVLIVDINGEMVPREKVKCFSKCPTDLLKVYKLIDDFIESKCYGRLEFSKNFTGYCRNMIANYVNKKPVAAKTIGTKKKKILILENPLDLWKIVEGLICKNKDMMKHFKLVSPRNYYANL